MKKIVAVTGAANGIGREAARLFAEHGWFVVGLDLDLEGLSTWEQALGEGNCLAIQTDITSPQSLGQSLQIIEKRGIGHLDVLLNCAGIIAVGDFDVLPLEKQLSIIDVNLKGTVATTHVLLPLLKAGREATIINMSSASAIYGNPEISVYAATKAAVASLTEGLNLGLAKHGIHVTDLWPIYVRTGMVTDHLDQYSNLSIEKVKLTPETVAQKIWQAAHNRKKVHWMVGTETKLFWWLSGFLPTRLKKALIKKVIGYR